MDLEILINKIGVPTPDKLLVGKDKVTVFFSWLENR